MPESIDFLHQRTDTGLRREIRNILDSYSNPWDVLAELCQNAVDSVRAHHRLHGEEGTDGHEVRIRIDAPNRAVTCADTGVGFDIDKFGELLAPHGGNKDADVDQIGEKGVGLTYTIFISNEYEIETKSANGYIKGTISQAATWADGHGDEIPVFEPEKSNRVAAEPDETFTRIHLADITDAFEPQDDLFNQTVEGLEFWLRTKTALGSVRRAFREDENLDLKITLEFRDQDGNETGERELAFEYLLPEDLVGQDKIVQIDDYRKEASALDDAQRGRKLGGKALVNYGSIARAGRSIRYYAFFAPSRELWEEISERNNLVQIDDDGEEQPMYGGGIYVATKGMPTGIELDPPRTGLAGYWPNFHMVIEDNSINFDVGRKSVPHRTKGMLRDVARSVFLGFQPEMTYATKPPEVTPRIVREREKAQEFSRLEDLSNLGVDRIRYAKHPNNQEAAVVAIFHELIGAGVLKGYHIYATGYRQTYDAWGKYIIDVEDVGEDWRHLGTDGQMEVPLVIEHKFSAESVLKDFELRRKFFTDIDLIVCWDFDEAKFARQRVQVEPLKDEKVLFYGSNFKLIWAAAYGLGDAGEKYVLCLRRFIESM